MGNPAPGDKGGDGSGDQNHHCKLLGLCAQGASNPKISSRKPGARHPGDAQEALPGDMLKV